MSNGENKPPIEQKDGRFKEVVSSEWAKIRADPKLYEDYLARKRRYREKIKSGEVKPRKRGIMFMTATSKTQTRASIISEIMDRMYDIEWKEDESKRVLNILKDFHSLGGLRR